MQVTTLLNKLTEGEANGAHQQPQIDLGALRQAVMDQGEKVKAAKAVRAWHCILIWAH